MFRKFKISSDIGEIRDRCFKTFALLVIAESVIRFVICLSFPSKLYALSLAGIIIVFTSLYILYVRKALMGTYAIGVTLLFFFLTHFVYVTGTYRLQPVMLLWFLVIPIVARVFFSNKVSLIITAITAVSAVFITKTSSLTGIQEHYKEIVLDYYGNPAAEFIVNFFILIILLYIVLMAYFLIRVLITEYSGKSKDLQENKKSDYLEKENDLSRDIPEEKESADTHSIRDVRLQGIYQSVTDYMQKSECYLNPEYTLTQLAADLNINKVTISNSLHQVGEISFKDLLNRYRIDKAKELFENDTFQSSNIKETYMNVGFKYHTTFNRAFKKQEGITPTEYIVKVIKINKLEINN